MKQLEINWNYICINEYDSLVEDFLDSKILEKIFQIFPQKIIMVLWWDGTMLRAIKEHYKKQLPFLWINFWNKWFLMNSKEILTQKIKFIERYYPLLEVEVKVWNILKKSIAFNEIDIRAWNGKMISLDIFLSKKQTINIEWDWIIVCTPAWSTWYNNSLSWPIIPHTLNAFAITPKAPWKPKLQAPILINDNEIIEVLNVWRRQFVEIYSDWKEVIKTRNWHDIKIKIKKSTNFIKLLIWENYINIWDNKVLQEQGFKI